MPPRIKQSVGSWAISDAAKMASQLASGVVGATASSNVSPGPANAINVPAPPLQYHPPAAPGHLYYGGSISPKGALGPKPELGRQFRNQRRLELIVRLENAGIPESAISGMLTITVNRLRSIKKSPDYLAARIKITTGLIIDQDGALEETKAQRKEMLTRMLPAALQVIANAVHAPAITLGERRFQHEVARDILDREGTLAKVQRAEVVTAPAFDWTIHEATSIQILSVAAAGTTGIVSVQDAVERADKIDAAQKIIDAFRSSAAPTTEQAEDLIGSLDAEQGTD